MTSRKRIRLVQTAFGLTLGLSASSPVEAGNPGADIFIGTLAVEQVQVFLIRCNASNPRYVLRGDPDTNGDALAAVRAGAYAKVFGLHVDDQGHHALLVRQIDTVTPDRDCHLSAEPEQAEAAPAADDHALGRMEPLLAAPGKEGSLCTAAGDWCVTLEEPGDQEGEITISGRVPAKIPVAAQAADGGFDQSLVSIWPVWTRLADGGALFGVINEQRTMYSGGGASASTLTLYRLSPGSAPSVVLDLPWEASSMIRACFSEHDFRQRAGACHDEYTFTTRLSIAPGEAGAMPVLRYETEATSFPGAVSRSADSLAARPLKRRDLVQVTNDRCSVTRLFRFDAAAGRYGPESPLPECRDYTDL